ERDGQSHRLRRPRRADHSALTRRKWNSLLCGVRHFTGRHFTDRLPQGQYRRDTQAVRNQQRIQDIQHGNAFQPLLRKVQPVRHQPALGLYGPAYAYFIRRDHRSAVLLLRQKQRQHDEIDRRSGGRVTGVLRGVQFFRFRIHARQTSCSRTRPADDR
ncbi:MAG: hypothetical protein ACD_47C00110G0001, partial [uncultured bacterium]